MAAWGVPIVGHTRIRCQGATCGCRHNPGMDCTYETLFYCSECGGMEGSLLPFCPGRRLTMEEDQRNYAHYCAATGPFARATLDTVREAVDACRGRSCWLPVVDLLNYLVTSGQA